MIMRRFLAIIAIGLAVGGCSGLSSEQVSEVAKEITVLIDGCSVGSGVIFKHDSNTYSVVTASHVVKNTNGNCLIITSDKERYTASDEVIFPLPGVDLAVLKFQSNKNYKLAEWADSDLVSIGTSVYVAGAPALSEVIQERDVEVQGGKIIRSQLSKSIEGYALVYNSSTEKGMSGGPVLNEEGRVIGIHGYKDPQEGSKNGRNLGIPINKFLVENLAPIPEYIGRGMENMEIFLIRFFWAILLAIILLITVLLIGGIIYLISYYYPENHKEKIKNIAHEFSETLFIIFFYLWTIIVFSGGRGIFDFSYFIQGNIYQQFGDNQAAIAAYNKAIKINPNYAYAYVSRGVAYHQLGDDYTANISYYWSIYFSIKDKGYFSINKTEVQNYCNLRHGALCTITKIKN
jgi:Trypsin-like peptidase domain/TPR repeat